jgi:hypothetical protein
MLSFEDNVYFTLRDIFLNINVGNFILSANSFKDKLSGHITFEERTPDFQYAPLLNNKIFVKQLYIFLSRLKKHYFEIEEEPYIYTIKNYIKFDDWWSQFENLKTLINERNIELQNE